MPGCVFIVSTPIGNMRDISLRAIDVLKQVDCVAAEDTRKTGQLLAELGVEARLVSLHEHNEEVRAGKLLEQVCQGQSIALVSDAGTPLVSDPGYRLVRLAQQQGVQVVPIPGASALLAAIAVAGLPSDRFLFAGFPPSKSAARRKWYEQVADESATLIFYEAPHRILASLQDAVEIFGPEREAAVCRELTKQFETVRRDSLENLRSWVESDSNQQRGELVLVVRGASGSRYGEQELLKLAALLKGELAPARLARVLANWSGRKKSDVYRLLEEKNQDSSTQ